MSYNCRTPACPLQKSRCYGVSGRKYPSEPYSWDEAAQLNRGRWDIEVFFKFVKQHLSYSHLPSRSENGIRVMLYMSLIAAVLLICPSLRVDARYKQQTGIDRGWRSVKFWLAEDMRQWTQELLQSARLAPDGGHGTNKRPAIRRF